MTMSSSAVRNLTLEFSDDSARKFSEEVRNKQHNGDVQGVVVYTHPYPDFDLMNPPWRAWEKTEDWTKTPDVPGEFRKALRQIDGLPNLKSFDLRFTKECAVDTGEIFIREVPETEDYRLSMLGKVFSVLDQLVAAGRPIESLAIKNLQNTKISTITSSSEFKAVMGNVKQLHLSICTEYVDHSPESSIDLPEYMDYPLQLRTAWLGPVRDHLTHLSLYWDVFFGVVPILPDYANNYFPKLKSLTLGNYAFGNDRQLNWILSHADTLEELVLDENAIVHHIGVYSEEELKKFRIDTRALERIPTTDDAMLFKYGKRWHSYFDALRLGLPHLRSFRFGSNWHAPRGSINSNHNHEFENRYQMVTELFPGRYVVFDSGIGPTQWLSPDEDGGYPDAIFDQGVVLVSPDIECHDEDQRALDKLLETVSIRDT